jgi:MATE family multidrug resistance protein
MVLLNALMGVGDVKRVMMISTGFQWFLFLPAVYFIGLVLGMGLVAVFAAQIAYRLLQSITFASIWKAGWWQAIKLH